MIAFRKIHLTILLFGVTAQGFEFKCGFNDSAAEEEIFGGANTRTAHETHSFYDWPRNGEGKVVVPYVWVNANGRTREEAEKNFRLIEDRLGCVKFVESRNQAIRKELNIKITKKACGNGTPGGSVGGPRASNGKIQDMPFTISCMLQTDSSRDVARKWSGTFLHEVWHVFGITHTQRRSDRDDYITVFFDRIWRNKWGQYDKCNSCPIPEGVPYECNSIMHYSTRGFANSNQPTMEAKDPNSCRLPGRGEDEWPTENDWLSLEKKVCSEKEEPKACAPGWKKIHNDWCLYKFPLKGRTCKSLHPKAILYSTWLSGSRCFYRL